MRVQEICFAKSLINSIVYQQPMKLDYKIEFFFLLYKVSKYVWSVTHHQNLPPITHALKNYLVYVCMYVCCFTIQYKSDEFSNISSGTGPIDS